MVKFLNQSIVKGLLLFEGTLTLVPILDNFKVEVRFFLIIFLNNYYKLGWLYDR